MRRREFIALFAGATAWPLAVRGQQPDKVFKIGFIATGGVPLYTNAFLMSCRRWGWIEGKNVIYEADTLKIGSTGCRNWWPNCSASTSTSS